MVLRLFQNENKYYSQQCLKIIASLIFFDYYFYTNP